jgi:hypothetical protein
MILKGIYDHMALVRLGAERVIDILAEDGSIDGVEVTPDIDIAGYEAALAAHRHEIAVAAARAECARRITAAASVVAQLNMLAHATMLQGRASLSPSDKADLSAFAEATTWVAEMRARWPQIAEQGLDPAEDGNWPQLPAAAQAFAARF